MRRILLRLVVFLLLQVGVGWAIYSSALLVHRPGYLAALDDKLHLLKKDGPPRIIFVGGSSVAFGIDSQMFASHLEQPAINLGLHGALGLEFYLRMVEEHARPGDSVVLLPEYSLLLKRHEISPEDLRRILRNSPSAVRYLRGNHRSVKVFLDTMALSELAYWTQKGTVKQRSQLIRMGRRSWLWVKRRGRPLPPIRVRPRKIVSGSSIYRRDSFNEFGDMVAHHGQSKSAMLRSEHTIVYRKDVVRLAVQRLNRFAAICQRRGVNVYFSYPPIPHSEFNKYRDKIRKLQNVLETSLAQNVTILNSPDDSSFPESMFYDTVTHLGEAGQRERSEVLLRGLSREVVARRQTDNGSWR